VTVPVDSIATVATRHPRSQSAMATKSQELAPNRRTLEGKPAAAVSAAGITDSAGTPTMCMLECTSIPAASRRRRVRTGGCARGGRDALDRGLPERLRWLIGSATLCKWWEGNRRGSRGEREKCSFPNGINASVLADASHQWQGRRLSGQVASRAGGASVGHGPTPLAPS